MTVLMVGVLAAVAVLAWPVRRQPVPVSDVGDVERDEAYGFLRRWRQRWGRGGSARMRSAELALVDGLASALDAGLPVPRAVRLAVEETGPGAGSGWGNLSRAAAEGQQLAPAWQRLARQTGSPTVAAVARAWRISALTGAPLADALRVSAHVARERQRLARAVEVATAGPRASVTVLSLLPLAGVALAAVLGVGPSTLYGHPLAQASAGTGALLVLVGQVWVRRMVSAVVGRMS